jgi:magnesium chelatase family protein
LFLDELAEYKRDAIESMRQALEDGYIHISRVHGQVKLPSEILLCATMNPCKCGYLFSEEKECTCSDREIRNYLGRISGPILDRIDLVFEVQSVDISQTAVGLNTNTMRKSVMRALVVQKKRFEKANILFNSQMKGDALKKYCSLDEEAEHILNESSKAFSLSKRVQNKLLMIARTISDFEQSKIIKGRHMAEAVQYRIAVSRLRGDNI